MPENIRVLIVILVIATFFFAVARRSACTIIKEADFRRRRNLWFALTLAAFLSYSFWVYLAIAVPLLVWAKRRESNPPAQFFFLLFVLPIATIPIPGFGLMNFVFGLSHARMLELLVLLPALYSLRGQNAPPPFGLTKVDKILVVYLLVTVILHLRGPSLTDTLRFAFYQFIDVYLPYFVISRSLKNIQDFRDVLLSMVLAIMVLAPLAIFESYKHWLLYSYVTDLLKLEGGKAIYLGRESMLRAITTTGQPIALGYLMAVGMGLHLFVQRFMKNKLVRRLSIALLVGGLIAPLSRGPWVGAAAMLVVFIFTGHYAARQWINMALAALLVFPLISVLPGGEKVINLLPFIGTTEKENVDYRQQLITNSMIVIKRNPWFGSLDYLKTPEMEAMRQGGGIIDIVNTYIQIALDAGLVGLGLFVSFFVLTLLDIYRAMRSVADKGSDEYLLGRALLSTLLGILIIIFSVSSITIIPIVYWSVAGLGVAYAQMVRKNVNRSQARTQ